MSAPILTGVINIIIFGIVDMNTLADILTERIIIDERGLGDMWPVFYDPELFPAVVAALSAPLEGKVNKVVGIESRGFILGAAVAAHLRVGFVGIRKSEGLFPGTVLHGVTSADYRGRKLALRLQTSSLGEGDDVAIVDDWFETGSQAAVAKELIERSGASYRGSSVIVDQLTEAKRADITPCYSLILASQMNFP
jgi:adenine phosphoribosyltransferase